MKHLKVWQKLVLMGVLFLIPFAVVTFKLISSVNTLGVNFARQERNGLRYLKPLHGYVRSLQRHRGLAAGFLSGDTTFKSDLQREREQIADSTAAVDAVDMQLGAVLDTTERWRQIKSEAQNLVERTPALSAQESFEAHTRLIAEAIALVSHVGDTSKLTLDPDLDSYYLMNVTVFQGPEAAEKLGQIRALGTAIATEKKFSAVQRKELSRLAAVLDYIVAGVDLSLTKAIANNAALKPQVEDMISRHSEPLRDFRQAYARLADGSAPSTGPQQFFLSATSAVDAEYSLLNQILPTLDRLLEARALRLEQEVTATLLQALLGLLAVSAIGFLLMRDITRPLRSALGASEKIAGGDLTVQLDNDNRHDEIGALITMQARMATNLREHIGKLIEGVNVLSASSSQILYSTSQLAAGSSETAAAVTETSTTVEEVKQTAQLSSQKARDVADTAQEAAAASYTGHMAVTETVAGMEHIRTQMSHIADSVIELSEQSQAIGDIISTVNDLAEQSNLLAVNAAIEAAKAGEHGRGFAVVAQEVKSLAEQSKQATAEVRTMLNQIQKATGTAVMATEQGSKAVDAGLAQCHNANEAIQTLSDSIDDAAQAAMQIAASSQEQLVGVDQVALAMNSIKEASTQTVVSMKELENAAHSLNDVGNGLKELAAHYHV